MNKKFISAFMLGLLTLGATSTITSCKDYDGDISNLQTQIDKLASKDELQNKINDLQTKIDAAKNDAVAKADAAMKAAQNAQATADNAATKEQLANLQKTVADLAESAATKAQLQTLQDLVDQKADEATVNAAIKALQDQDKALEEALDAAKTAQAVIDGAQDTEIAKAIKATEDNAAAIKTLNDKVVAEYATKKELSDAIAAVKTDYEKADKELQDALGQVKTLAESNAASIDKLNEVKADKAVVETLAEVVNANNLAVQASIANVNVKIDNKIEEVKALIEGIEMKLKEMIGAYSTMITAINLFTTVEDHTTGVDMNNRIWDEDASQYIQNPNYGKLIPTDHVLNFGYAKELTNNFGDGFVPAAQVIKTEDGKFVTTAASVVVRVSPASAVLKAENVGLVNSQGATLDEYLDVEVKPYEELLSRSTTLPTGLWTVSYKLKETYNAENFAKAIAVQEGANKGKSVIFAVSVKNDNEKVNADRVLVSEFDLTAKAEEAGNALADFKVNNVCVQQIKNRYGLAGATVLEYGWAAAKKDYPSPWTEVIKELNTAKTDVVPAKSNVKKDDSDDRHSKDILPVSVDEDIVIDFDCDAEENHNIRGFYVVLDNDFAEKESAPSELNAWNGYTYENVGKLDKDGKVIAPATMFMGKKGTIKVTAKTAEGDIIGFRVFAVNQNGTLVDPDGKAFYVRVGDATSADVTLPTADLNITKAAEGDNVIIPLGDAFKNVDFNAINGDALANTISVYSEEDADGKTPEFKVTFLKANKSTKVTPDDKDAAFAKIETAEASNKYIDGATYTLKLKVQKQVTDVADQLLRTVEISVKKVMPTTVPELKVRTGMSSPFTAYLKPSSYIANAAANATGEINFEEFFVIDNGSNNPWQFTLADVDKVNNVLTSKSTALNTYKIVGIGKDYINNNNHSVSVQYSYGAISKNDTAIETETAVTATANGYYEHTSRYYVPSSETYEFKLTHYGYVSDYSWFTRAHVPGSIYGYEAPSLTWETGLNTTTANSKALTLNFAADKPGNAQQTTYGVLAIENTYSAALYGGVLHDLNTKYYITEAKLLNCDQFTGDFTIGTQSMKITQKEFEHKPAPYTAKVQLKIRDTFGRSVTKTLDIPVKVQE